VEVEPLREHIHAVNLPPRCSTLSQQWRFGSRLVTSGCSTQREHTSVTGQTSPLGRSAIEPFAGLHGSPSELIALQRFVIAAQPPAPSRQPFSHDQLFSPERQPALSLACCSPPSRPDLRSACRCQQPPKRATLGADRLQRLARLVPWTSVGEGLFRARPAFGHPCVVRWLYLDFDQTRSNAGQLDCNSQTLGGHDQFGCWWRRPRCAHQRQNSTGNKQ